MVHPNPYQKHKIMSFFDVSSSSIYWGCRLGLVCLMVAICLPILPCMGQDSPLQPLTKPAPLDSAKTISSGGSDTDTQPISTQPHPNTSIKAAPYLSNLRKPVIAAIPLSISSVQTHMGILLPAGDLAKRFGAAGQVGLEFGRIVRGKWLMGGNITHLFSNSVREQDIFSNIATESGDVITRDGVFEDYRLRMFGWLMSVRIGHLIPINPARPNRGFSMELGFGLMQHKIRIETPVLNSPQLSAEYKRGYDRLSNGLCVSPALGYLHYAPNRRINYFIRLEGHVAQTRNRRTVNYDTGLPDHRLRRDALWGLRVGWILPLYRRAEKEVNFF